MELPTRNLKSLISFKSLINTKNTNVPAHYYVGCRLGQILHARLRMNCSALIAHLFIRNIIESPNCISGITETVVHFVLDCPLHTTLRDRQFNLQEGYGFLFRSENCFRTTQELEYLFFLSSKARNLFSRI